VKKQSSAVKAVRDIRSVPPQAYVLPSDGRKLKHLCRERRSLALQLSTHANPDGTGIHVSEITLARDMGKSRRQIVYLMKDLRTLGYMLEEGWQLMGVDAHGNQIRTRKRRLDIPTILAAGRAPGATAQDTSEGSAQDTQTTAQDTQGQCATYVEPLRKIGEDTAQDSYCAEPAFAPAFSPTIQPPTQLTPPKGGVREGVCVDSNKPQSLKAFLASEATAADTLDQVMKYCPTDMLASQWKRDEKQLAEKMIAEHGWETFIAVLKMYWQEQDPQQFGKTLFKWSGMLTSFPGWLRKVTPAVLRQQAEQRFRDTPAGEAEYQRMVLACIEKANREEKERDAAGRAAWLAKRSPVDIEQDRRAAVRQSEIIRLLKGEEVFVDKTCWESEEIEGCFFQCHNTDRLTGDDLEFSVDEATGKLQVKRIAKQKGPSWEAAKA
jgi:hypothetical protein